MIHGFGAGVFVLVAVRVTVPSCLVTTTCLEAVAPFGPVASACLTKPVSVFVRVESYVAVLPLKPVACALVVRPVSVFSLLRLRLAVFPLGNVAEADAETFPGVLLTSRWKVPPRAPLMVVECPRACASVGATDANASSAKVAKIERFTVLFFIIGMGDGSLFSTLNAAVRFWFQKKDAPKSETLRRVMRSRRCNHEFHSYSDHDGHRRFHFFPKRIRRRSERHLEVQG